MMCAAWVRRSVMAAAVLLYSSGVGADGRNLRFAHLSLEHGLSQGAVNAILQDDHGFLWFGTQDGLNRYDGNRVEVFRHEIDDPSSLSHSWIWDLHEDRDGNLWVATVGGLDRLNSSDGTFTHLRHDPSNPFSLSDDRVRVLHEDASGALWVGTERGLNRFDAATGRFERFQHDPDDTASLSNDRVRAIYEDRQGRLWAGTYGGGLSWLDRETGRFHRIVLGGAGLNDDRVRLIYEDRMGSFWIGTYEGGVTRFDPRTGASRHFAHDPGQPASLSGNRVRAILEDDQGTLWIGTNGGLSEWRKESDDFVNHRNDPSDPGSLSENRVMSMLQDRGGVIWVGTQGGGLNRWNPHVDVFTRFQRSLTAASTLSSNIILSFSEDVDGTLWVGTFEGLNRLDRNLDTVTQFRHDANDEESLSDDRVMSLHVDHRRVLWIGTYSGGLNRRDPDTGVFVRYKSDPSNPESISSDAITSILDDRNKTLWVGTFGGGLNRFDRETATFLHYRHHPDDDTSLGSDRVTSLLEDSSGFLWVGTDGGGLCRLDRKSGRFHTFRHDPTDPSSLGSDVVFSVAEDSRGTLWVGTQGGGLSRLSSEDRRLGQARFRRYGQKDGLPNPTVNGILEDEEGHLWVSTNHGLSSFDPATAIFKSYDVTNGLQSNEFNMGAYHRSPGGEMFFGGNEGFSAFYPAHIRNNSHVPPVVLTSFLKFNRPVALGTSAADIDDIELGYRDSVVSFEFSALDYTAPERNRYAYILEGFHGDWIDLGELNRVTFTNLDPGAYTLRVKGSNNDGVWNEDGLAIGLRVLPPPWRSWWAYSLYAIVFLSLVWLYAHSQAAKLERKVEYARQLEREVRERTQELADRNDELQLANRQLEKASVTDALTGLRNRRFLTTNIQRDLALVERFYAVDRRRDRQATVRPDLVFLVFDLDGFKEINDAYGHASGDSVLLQVRDILHTACRESDTIIRWGGDEFLVVARNADREIIGSLAERIRRAVAEHPFDVGLDEPVRLSCSIGFANFPFVASEPSLFNWEQVVAIADGALYQAKTAGRNGWVGAFSTERTAEASADAFIKKLKLDATSLVDEGILELTGSNPLADSSSTDTPSLVNLSTSQKR